MFDYLGSIVNFSVIKVLRSTVDKVKAGDKVMFSAEKADGAIVANVARGKILDTEALLAELESERISAFLDVTEPEPLPSDHPLWDAPNVIISPHVAGGIASQVS